MPRFNQYVDVALSVDTSDLESIISDIEARISNLEEGGGDNVNDAIDTYLHVHDYLTRYQVQADFASTEYAWHLEKRLEELERYNMPERMADMGVLLAELRERTNRPKFSFMRWLRGLINA